MTLLEVLKKHSTARNLEDICKALEASMQRFEINTVSRQAMFIAQCLHESGHFLHFMENLNYSAQGLANTWPKRYAKDGKPNDLALKHARNPRAIANFVYADRMGNGNEASGDGFNYRGRGVIQLTGRANYVEFKNSNPEIDAVKNPDLLSQMPGAIVSACWFWRKNNLNRFADKNDIEGCTKAINGGLIGLADRKKIWEALRKELS